MILQRRYRGLAMMHGLCQMALLGVVFVLLPRVYDFSLVVRDSGYGVTNYRLYLAVLLSASLLDLTRAVAKNLPVLHLTLGENLRRSSRQVLTLFIGLQTFLVLAKDPTISRSFLIAMLLTAFLLFFTTNSCLPSLLAKFLFTGSQGLRTVVFGGSSDAGRIWDWLEARKAFGFEVVGILDPQDWRRLTERLAEYHAQQLIVLGLPKYLPRIQEYWRACEKAGVRLLVLNDSKDYIGRTIEIDEQDGMQFVTFQKDILECPMNRALKRLFDLVIGVPICLFVLPPLALVVWWFQQFQAPGPLFYRQRRSGVHGREFWIFKFRSMYVNNGADHIQACHGDARIYPAGRWLRRLSLDEFPQFINVVLGEMSVVGPRPHLHAHDMEFAKSAQAYRLRQFTKPGITGLAQVKGWRGETRTPHDVVKRTEADIEYLQKWSFLLDMKIVLKTGWQLLFPPRTAY